MFGGNFDYQRGGLVLVSLGMGLYLSRFIVRSYGGELRYEPGPSGSCFAVELEAVHRIGDGLTY